MQITQLESITLLPCHSLNDFVTNWESHNSTNCRKRPSDNSSKVIVKSSTGCSWSLVFVVLREKVSHNLVFTKSWSWVPNDGPICVR